MYDNFRAVYPCTQDFEIYCFHLIFNDSKKPIFSKLIKQTLHPKIRSHTVSSHNNSRTTIKEEEELKEKQSGAK